MVTSCTTRHVDIANSPRKSAPLGRGQCLLNVLEGREVSVQDPVPCTLPPPAAGGRARESETTSLVLTLCQTPAPSRLERGS